MIKIIITNKFKINNIKKNIKKKCFVLYMFKKLKNKKIFLIIISTIVISNIFNKEICNFIKNLKIKFFKKKSVPKPDLIKILVLCLYKKFKKLKNIIQY